MRKSAILVAALVLASSSAYAYENSYAGYSVKDKNPYYIAETERVYAFSDIKANNFEAFDKLEKGAIHVSSYYTAKEMEQVIGEKFSTAYFDAQYEKLALLERSGLSKETIALPILNFTNYAKVDNLSNVYDSPAFKMQMEQIKPTISVSKFGKHKGITVSYLYRQENVLLSMDTTLLSANDRLYMLSTVNVDEKTFASPVSEPVKDKNNDYAADVVETDTKAPESVVEAVGGADGKTSIEITEEEIAAEAQPAMTMGEFRNALKKATKLESVKADDLDPQIAKRFASSHKKYVKSFKALTPAATPKPLTYYDAIMGKRFTLPKDWFYGQINLADKSFSANLTVSGSMDMARKMNKTLVSSGIFQDLYFGYDDPAIPDDMPVSVAMGSKQEKYTETMKQMLRDFDGMLITGSIKPDDPDLIALLERPRSAQVEAEMFLRDGLSRLQNMPNTEQYFKLNDYRYIVDFSDMKGLIDIYMNTTILQEMNWIHQLRLSCTGGAGTAMWFVKSADYQVDEEVNASLQQWQF